MICLVKLSVPNYLCDTAMRNRQRRGTTWHSYTWVPAARKDSAPTKTWSERLGFSRLQPNLALRLHRLPTHTSTCGKRVSSCQLSFTLLLLCLSRPSNVFLFVCDFIREYLSQMRLGFCYDSGQGVNKDAAKAADWYARAVDQGLAGAQVSRTCLKRTPTPSRMHIMQICTHSHAHTSSPPGQLGIPPSKGYGR